MRVSRASAQSKWVNARLKGFHWRDHSLPPG
jgi:hypothetical protein